MAKKTIKRQETYQKGTFMEIKDVKKLLDNNVDNMVVELKERTRYSDDSESIILKLTV
jgi:hypothetical protein